jgi:hypothetical protein
MNDTDLEGLPIVSKGSAQRNYVAPAPLATRQPPAVIDAPAWMVQGQPLDVGRAWQASDGAREQTSAMDRAQALKVRLQPFLWAWAGIGVVLGVTVWLVAGSAPTGALLAVLTFAALTAFSYYRLNRTDYDHSREGTERLRISAAERLAMAQLEHEAELKRMALSAYLEQLKGRER